MVRLLSPLSCHRIQRAAADAGKRRATGRTSPSCLGATGACRASVCGMTPVRTIGSYCLLMAGRLGTGLRPSLTRRLRPGGWVALDCALAGVLAVMFAVSSSTGALWYGQPRWGVVMLAASSALPVAVRRLWPVAALGAVTVLTAAGMALGATHLQPLSMIFVMYTAGLRTSRRTGLCLLGGSLL